MLAGLYGLPPHWFTSFQDPKFCLAESALIHFVFIVPETVHPYILNQRVATLRTLHRGHTIPLSGRNETPVSFTALTLYLAGHPLTMREMLA